MRVARNWSLWQKWQNFPVNSLLLYAIDRGIVYLRHKNQTPPLWAFYFCARNVSGFEPDERVRTAAKRRNNAGRHRRFCKVGVSQYFVSASIIPLRRRGVFMRRIKTGRVFTWLILKIAFLCNLWYNIRINRTARCRPFFIVPHSAGFFYLRG